MPDDAPRPPTAPSDAEVLRAFHSCDGWLLKEMARYFPGLAKRKRKRAKDRTPGDEYEYDDDFVQEVYLKTWMVANNAKAPVHDIKEFAKYAFRSVYNALADYLKAKKRREKVETLVHDFDVIVRRRNYAPLADTAGDGYEDRLADHVRRVMETDEDLHMLAKASRVMGPASFEVLRLKVGYHTFEEIANLLGVSVKTVRSRWGEAKRGWKKLKDAGSLCWGLKHGLIDRNRE